MSNLYAPVQSADLDVKITMRKCRNYFFAFVERSRYMLLFLQLNTLGRLFGHETEISAPEVARTMTEVETLLLTKPNKVNRTNSEKLTCSVDASRGRHYQPDMAEILSKLETSGKRYSEQGDNGSTSTSPIE